MAGTVGHISVDVRPDFDGFRDKVKASLRAVEKSVKLRVPVEADLNANDFRRAARRAERLVGDVKSTVAADIDIASFRLAQRKAEAVIKSAKMPVVGTADIKRTAAEIAKIRAFAEKSVGKSRIDFIPDVRRAELARVQRLLDTAFGSRRLEIVPSFVKKDLSESLLRVLDTLGDIEVPVGTKVDGTDALADRAQLEKIFSGINAKVKTSVDTPTLQRAVNEVMSRFRDGFSLQEHTLRVRTKIDHDQFKHEIAGVLAKAGPLKFSVRPQLSSIKPLQKELDGETMWAYAGGVWKKGSLDGLKRTFYKALPDLKPWVWPQVDVSYLKDVRRRLMDGLRNLNTEISAKVVAQWRNAPTTRKKLEWGLKGLTALVDVRAKNSKWVGGIYRLVRQVSKDATIPVRPIFDKTARVRATAQIQRFKRRLKNSDGEWSIKAVWNNRSETTVRARLKALEATLAKGTTYRVKVAVDGLSNLYRLYRQTGLRSVMRWKIQLEIKEAQRAFQTLVSMMSRTMKSGAIISGFSMIGTAVLGWIGAIKTALKQIGPAFWPALAAAGSFATAAGVSAIALRNARDQLATMVPLVERIDAGINRAFWDKARSPMLENLSKFLEGIEDNLTNLAGVMGDFFAAASKGLSNSTGQWQKFIDNTSEGFEILDDTIQRVIETLSKLLSAGSEFFPEFAQWLDDLSVKFSDWVTEIENSPGGLEAWMRGGIESAKLLGSIIGNLMGIIGDFAALAAGSADDMKAFNDRLVGIRETIASPEFQDGMGAFFAGVKRGSAEMMDALGRLAQKLAEHGDQVGNLVAQFGGLGGTLMDTLGSAILNPQLLTGVTGLVSGFQALADAVQPVVVAFMQGLGPIFVRLGDTLRDNADGVARFADTLSRLALISFANMAQLVQSVLPHLTAIMDQVGPQLVELAELLLPAILKTMETLLPVLGPLAGEILSKLVQGLIDILPTIMQLVDSLLPPLLSLFDALAPVIANLVTAGFQALEGAIAVITPILSTLIENLEGPLTAAFEWLQGVLESAGEHLSSFADFLNENDEAAKIVTTALTALVAGMGALWATIKIGNGLLKIQAVMMKANKAIMAVWNGVVKAGTAVQKIFNAVMRANPMVKLVAIISAVVAGLVWFFTQTEIGQKIWEGFVNFLSSAWEWLKNTASSVWEAITGFFTGAADKVSAVWGGITEWFSEQWNAVKEQASALWDGVTETFSNAWDSLVELWGNVGEWFSEKWTAISDGASELWETVKELFTGAWETISELWGSAVEFFSEVWAGITEGFNEFTTFLSETWTAVTTWLSETWNTMWTAISDFAVAIWDTIVGWVTGAWTNIQTLLQTGLTFVQTLWNTIWTAISTAASTIWATIKSVISTAITAVRTTISNILSAISGTWNSVWGTISSFASTVWGNIKSAVSSGIETVKSKISSVLRTIDSIWSGAWGAIKSGVETTWNKITGMWSSGVSTVRGIFDRMASAIKGPFETAFNAIKGLWNNTVGKLSFKIPGWVPGIGGKGWSAPKLATGGIVTEPTLAWVGEGKSPTGGYVPEAVIPLPKLQPMLNAALKNADSKQGGYGNTYNVHMTVPIDDLSQVRTLEKFTKMIQVKSRMGVREGTDI